MVILGGKRELLASNRKNDGSVKISITERSSTSCSEVVERRERVGEEFTVVIN